MKLGKKVKQSELLDAMGGEISIAEVREEPARTSASLHSADKVDLEVPEVSARKGLVIFRVCQMITAQIDPRAELTSPFKRPSMLGFRDMETWNPSKFEVTWTCESTNQLTVKLLFASPKFPRFMVRVTRPCNFNNIRMSESSRRQAAIKPSLSRIPPEVSLLVKD